MYFSHIKTHTGGKPYGCNICDYKSVEKMKKFQKTRSENTFCKKRQINLTSDL